MRRRALIGVFGGLFTGYVSLAAAIPVLPGFVTERYGATGFTVGLVVMATALTALLVRPVAGHLADRYGHRRVMQLGALVVAVGGALYFAPIGVAGLVANRLLLGVGEAALFTAGAVWTVSLAPHNRRGQLIGLYGVSMWGGIAAGTFLGATLSSYGYATVWAFSIALGLAGLALVSSAPAPGKPERAGGGGLLLRPALLPGTALALAAAGYAGLAAFVVLHLQARGIQSGVAVLSGFSLVYAGTRLFIGHLPDRVGPRRMVLWCGIGEAAGLVIIAVAPNLPLAVLGGVVMGVGFSLLHPSLALMVMNRTDQAKQGAALGAYTSFWDLGLAVWGPLIGVVAGGLGYPAVFLVGAGCAVAAVGVGLCVRQPATLPAATS
ncbi:MFS transporter [Nonomuraea sp. SBT364]|uniref:MFS transporter n=1 Tax=Nonomuraea sp. SBT364 TaxID=1580530 RepID=UPI00066E1014|nr:MFS transporter [Nonomuraea sp. SBT364]